MQGEAPQPPTPVKEAPTTPPNHQDILTVRDNKLRVLEQEIRANPASEWTSFEAAPNVSIVLPTQALIETEALIDDASSHLEQFRSGSQVVEDHGDIVRNPRSYGFLMQGVFRGVTDWEGLKIRIALQRGMTLCEDKMEELDYDPEKLGYSTYTTRFDDLEKLLKSIDQVKPLK
jgi:hypothetical protein